MPRADEGLPDAEAEDGIDSGRVFLFGMIMDCVEVCVRVGRSYVKGLCNYGAEIPSHGELGCDASVTSFVRALMIRLVV